MNNKSDLTGLTVGNNGSFPFSPANVRQFGLMDYSLPVTEFQLGPLLARIEKIEQWIERQEQYQAEQVENGVAGWR